MIRTILPLLFLAGLVIAHEGDDHEHHNNRVIITERDGYRIITSNGLPEHATGAFPNRGNPHSIAAQQHSFRVPLKPTEAKEPIPLPLGTFGVALNGVTFDPGAAEFWQRNFRSGWQYDIMGLPGQLGLDDHHAHVQPTGKYHYHGIPTGLLKRLKQPGKPTLLGYAADGYPTYGPQGYSDPTDPESRLVTLRSSYKLKSGTRPTNPGPGGKYDGSFVQDYEYVAGHGDLDASNGRFGKTPEYPDGTYHYVLTESYPTIPRQFHGVPDPSFTRRGPGAGGRPNRPGPPNGRRPPFGRPPFLPPTRPR